MSIFVLAVGAIIIDYLVNAYETNFGKYLLMTETEERIEKYETAIRSKVDCIVTLNKRTIQIPS